MDTIQFQEEYNNVNHCSRLYGYALSDNEPIYNIGHQVRDNAIQLHFTLSYLLSKLILHLNCINNMLQTSSTHFITRYI